MPIGDFRARVRAIRSQPTLNRLLTGAARPLIRGVGRAGMSVAQHLPHVGPARSRLPNGRDLVLVGGGDEMWTSQLFWFGWSGFYEPETAQLFYALASHSRVTIDVGANIGIYTLLGAHANPRGRVFAFEPSPAYDRLLRNIAANDVDNVTAVRAAVGRTDGEAQFFSGVSIDRGERTTYTATSSLQREHVALDDEKLQSITATTVPICTIDRFVADHGIDRVDLVKVDAEKTEPDVLEGMRQTIARDRPSVVCEVIDAENGAALERLLEPFDYRWYHLTWMGPLERHEILPGNVRSCLNYLFTTADHAELLELFDAVKKAIK